VVKGVVVFLKDKFAWQTFMCFSVCYPLLFEATMPRRYARPDARGSDTTSFDVQTHHPALKLRVSRSASLIRRVTPRGRGSGVFPEHRFPRRIPEPSVEGLIARCVFFARPPPFETATRSARDVPGTRGGRKTRSDT
jgi:hypothetical protein